jgi:type II secretory pathway component PulJ
MEDITAEVLTKMTQKKQRLLALMKLQDELTADLVQLEKRYDVGAVSQAELERRRPELTRRQGKQQLSWNFSSLCWILPGIPVGEWRVSAV